ncbi:hypothetical protein C8Q79DRAFT_911960 [Trametes meyenii]|nr:hypothetical protein C8Q79DRAFT_911960 [Trametes meyenii]
MIFIIHNAEIVSSIVAFAYWGANRPNQPLDLHNVYALALTCHAFLEPALDQLWRRQLTLFNLVRTLPNDSWEVYDSATIAPDGKKQKWIKTTRVIVPKDWVRFDFYSAKIREMGFDPRAPFGSAEVLPWRREAVPQDVFNNLCIARPPYELVPNVRRIRWTTHEEELGVRPHVYMFLNPPLTGLTLDFGDAQMDRSPVYSDAVFVKYTLKAVTEQCPACRDVELVWPPFKGYVDAIGDFLAASPTLRTFVANVRGWKEVDLIKLASLPELRRTRLYVDQVEYPWLLRSGTPAGMPFSSLVDLTLDAPSLSSCSAFLAALGSCKLEALVVNCAERPSAPMLHNFCTTLSTACSPASLRVLSLSDDGADPPDISGPMDSTVSTEILQPLTSFAVLRSLTIDFSATYTLDDSFPDVLSPWSSLEKLSLGAKHGWGQRPALTFAGLAKVIQVYPMMEDLHLAIDATRDGNTDMPFEVRPNTRVRSIDLVDSYVARDADGAVTVSRNLAALFTELESIAAKMRSDVSGEEAMEGTDVPMSTQDESATGLATGTFWREVEKQVATFALLRNMDFPMDLS